RARLEVFLVRQAGVAEMHVQVHQPGQDVHPGGVEDVFLVGGTGGARIADGRLIAAEAHIAADAHIAAGARIAVGAHTAAAPRIAAGAFHRPFNYLDDAAVAHPHVAGEGPLGRHDGAAAYEELIAHAELRASFSLVTGPPLLLGPPARLRRLVRPGPLLRRL